MFACRGTTQGSWRPFLLFLLEVIDSRNWSMNQHRLNIIFQTSLDCFLFLRQYSVLFLFGSQHLMIDLLVFLPFFCHILAAHASLSFIRGTRILVISSCFPLFFFRLASTCQFIPFNRIRRFPSLKNLVKTKNNLFFLKST